MLARVADLIVRRARWVLAISVALVVAAAVVGAGVFPVLKGGGFDDPSSESIRARDAISAQFGDVQSNELLLVEALGHHSVDDPAVAAAASATLARLRTEPGVSVIADYWHAPAAAKAGLRSTAGDKALVLLRIDGDENQVMKRAGELAADYTTADHTTAGQTTADQVIRQRTGGLGQSLHDINGQVSRDLATAESIAIPITLLLLVFVFGSIVAGSLPLLVGGIAIAATFAVLLLLALVSSVSIFAINLTTALGLGLGIDYALLVVSRFREERVRHGDDVAAAVRATVLSAGRTVMFSAVTIAVSLAALMVFPLYFLQSFAYAGIAVVLVAALTAVVTLPALLVLLGGRVEALALPWRRRASARAAQHATGNPAAGAAGGLAGEGRFWGRLAAGVMRRPVLAALPVAALLLALGGPFLHVQFSVPDDRVISASASQARAVGDVLRADFAGDSSQALTVVVPQVSSPVALATYQGDLAKVPGVARVDVTARNDHAAVLSAVLSVDPNSGAAETVVHQVRSLTPPGAALVGGPSAALVDVKAAIGDRLPLGIGLIALVTFVVLFLFTGSVVLPLKALVINVISIGGVLGAMVWVFQDGHLSGLLGFTPLPLSLTMPLLMFCVAFGLSMDYELFLLSRIRELHLAGADTAAAVGGGLARTGQIVSAAAVLLAVTMFAFVSSKVSFLQMFGLGTGLAIVLDATLVRGVLVPALMRLMGRVNWWAPRPLRLVHNRIGLTEA